MKVGTEKSNSSCNLSVPQPQTLSSDFCEEVKVYGQWNRGKGKQSNYKEEENNTKRVNEKFGP